MTAPVEVAATRAPREVAGSGVGDTAFATALTGWAMVGQPGVSRLLYTSDAGASWTPQLAWHGPLLGRLTAFDARRAGLMLAVGPENGDVNGYQLASGGHTAVFAATATRGPAGPSGRAAVAVGGVYAYDGSHGWSRAHRLPMTPTRNGLHLLTFGADGQVCAASGRDLWVADDLGGPWEHRPVPLPADETIANVAPTGTGTLWLTTTRYPAPGTPPSGRLYRTENEGAVWTPVPVESQGRTGHE